MNHSNTRLAAALIALALAACGDKAAPDKAAPATPATPATPAAPGANGARPGAANANAASIALAPELAALVRIGQPATMQLTDGLRIAGRIEVNGYKTARIGAPVTGRIGDIRVVLGQDVRLGEPLAEISSQEATAAQLAFLKAHSAEQLNQRAVERAQLLISADVIGAAEVQRRQNELAVSRAEKRAAADQLRVLGISSAAVAELERTGRLIPTAPIAATLAGTVIERKIAIGQVVQPSDSLFVVSDLSSVWAAADIPEQEASVVSRGQRVEVEVPALGNERRAGKIVFVSDVVNPETRTVRVGVVLDNPGKQLKPAMLTTMLIEGKTANRTVVPATAVVRESDADHVFLITAPGTATLTRVNLGAETGGVRPLVDPLPPNQGLVVDGAFHLNNERQKRALEKS